MDTPLYQTLQVQYSDQVAIVSLNRPDKANALNAAMWSELQACFEWLDAEPEVRVVVLAGNGPHFCAGIDLSMFAEITALQTAEPARANEQLRLIIRRLQANLNAIEQCRKPVLAAVHGACVGAGLEMIACCDMRYADSSASFSIKEIDLGMTADVGALQRLPYWMPPGVVRELAYTGRAMDADEARALGLVNRCFAERGELIAEVGAIALQIAGKSPLAIRGVKRNLMYARDHTVSDGLDYVATWNSAMLSQRDVMASVSGVDSPVVFDD